ncbi:MAG TPA: type II toxin-antitoxin system prevent-host-death family antitoxin [Candidatus Saccharimonadales bacterium]|jgi:prevent-host-death family protein|nr:type II toxin-antitoxin system prevent-host-death family antitoxin [Candidatus Saccharimonadales bacterium]
MNKSAGTWTVAEGQAKFSEVVNSAQAEGPQTITRHGRIAVVVVATDECERKTKRKGNLAEFFAASPLRGSEVKHSRLAVRLKKADL